MLPASTELLCLTELLVENGNMCPFYMLLLLPLLLLYFLLCGSTALCFDLLSSLDN